MLMISPHPLTPCTLRRVWPVSPTAASEKLDLDPVRQAEGVVDVITFSDIPGDPDVSPVYTGDLLFADQEINYFGQPLFAVAATSLEAAKRAALLARVDVEKQAAVLTVQAAMAEESFVLPTRSFVVGDADASIQSRRAYD